MSISKKAIYVGGFGFPYGSATVYRTMQIATILINLGYEVLVINRRGIHSYENVVREKIKVFGNFKNVNYIHTSLKSYRPNNFVLRNIYKTLGLVNEFVTILYQKIFCRCELIICRSSDLYELRYYFYLSRLFKMRFVYDYVEFVDSFTNRDARSICELKLKFEKNVDKYADAYIVISKYLDNYLEGLNKYSNRVLIPPTQNFNDFDNIPKLDSNQKYFLYCGGVNYEAAIKFLIDAYINSNAIDEQIMLYLVINGSEWEIANLQKYVHKKSNTKSIIILSQLPYDLLISYYKSAMALLMPLRNTIQDQARFPFKICEYLASKRPVITSDVGVISEYFVDERDALIAIPDDIASFVEKMNFVISNSISADEIGNKGYSLGKYKFSDNLYNSDLLNLLK
jgi:glycosyltransferase involved in cell wall biosynthesis